MGVHPLITHASGFSVGSGWLLEVRSAHDGNNDDFKQLYCELDMLVKMTSD